MYQSHILVKHVFAQHIVNDTRNRQNETAFRLHVSPKCKCNNKQESQTAYGTTNITTETCD